MTDILRHPIIAYIILSFILAIAPQTKVLAEQSPLSVKECLEQPEKCQDTNEREPDKQNSKSDEAASMVSAWDFAKMFLAFLFVLALLYVLLKILNKRNRIFQANRVVQNLGGAPLGGNRSIQIIKMGERILVIGVGDSVQLLTEIKDKQEKEQLLQSLNESNGLQGEFKVILPGLFDKRKNRTEGAPVDFSSMLKDKMNEISNQRKNVMKELERNDRDNE
ncbi:MAG TPA: flagellar biosynthetic protein FliO [Bacillus sp. (in: firmicutes)]|nr:flagellar biosynthetic protein FliO [Bacillus sp. (in: firmicutes)]